MEPSKIEPSMAAMLESLYEQGEALRRKREERIKAFRGIQERPRRFNDTTRCRESIR